MNKEKNPILTKTANIETLENNNGYSAFIKIVDVDGFRAHFEEKKETTTGIYHMGTVEIEAPGRIESLEDHIKNLENHFKNLTEINQVKITMIGKKGNLVIKIVSPDNNGKLDASREIIAAFDSKISAEDIIREVNILLSWTSRSYVRTIIYKFIKLN